MIEASDMPHNWLIQHGLLFNKKQAGAWSCFSRWDDVWHSMIFSVKKTWLTTKNFLGSCRAIRNGDKITIDTYQMQSTLLKSNSQVK